MKEVKSGLILLIISGLLFPLVVFAVMSSTNYSIYADSIGFGGINSTSTSYNLQDTVGGSPAGFSSSSSYEIRSGYQSMEQGSLSVSIDNTSLNLGTLSESSVNSASTTVTVNTDSATGYTLSIGSAGSSPITAVSDIDGSVTAGSEEYGLAVTGTDKYFSNDRSIIAGRVLASANAPANSATVLTIKAAMSISTPVGSKSQSITLSTSANF